MRVLSLVPGLDPSRGGMATAATNMSLAAQAAGVECVLAVPAHGEGDPSSRTLIVQLEQAGVIVHALPVARWFPAIAYRWGISPAQAVWVLRHAGFFDVIHVHGVWGIGPLSGLLAGRLTNTPVVVTAHESLTAFDINDSRSLTRRRQKLLLKALYLRYASVFVLTSDLEAHDSLPASAPRRTVHYPVARLTGPVLPPPPRSKRAQLRVGFLGRIHPKKNLHLLIDAMQGLPEHVRLAVAGDGPQDLVQSLRVRADRAGVTGRVEWLGFVEPAARAQFFESIDLLAMPSLFESFGLAAAEAMLAEVPVIVSHRTGIAEVIGRHGGGHVIDATAPAIVSAVRELDTDRDALARLGTQGRAAVTMDLDLVHIGRALRDVYSDVSSTA